MEIKKQYDVKELAEKLRGRIKINNESDTRFVDIDMLTAVGILDVLEEIGRMESNKALENLKNGCDEKPECYGKYSLGSIEIRGCVKCSCEGECFIKSCRKKCFGTYVDTSSICANCTYVCECKKESNVKDAHVDCMGEYRGKLHKKCLLCNLSYICKTKTTKRVKDITGCFGEYDDSAIVCSGCKYSTACEEITSEERDNA